MGPLDPDPLEQSIDALLGQVMADTAAGVGIVDADLRYLYVNPALARMNGVPAEEHIGRSIREILPSVDDREEVMHQVLADGRSREVTSSGHTRAPSGLERRYWDCVFHRVEYDGRIIGVAGIVLEVSAARQEQHDLERARERLAMLDTAATRIGTTLEVDTTCGELAEFVVPVLADVATVEVFPVEQTDLARTTAPGSRLRLRRAAVAAVPSLKEAVKELGEPGEYIEFQESSQISRSMATGLSAILNLPSDQQMAHSAPSPERVAVYRYLGLHSAVVIPLTARGAPLGALTMARVGDSPAFTEEDVTAAQDLAGRAAISLDNARRYTREHGIALELQRALLSEPNSPHPGIEVASRYLPAGSSALVGGDWYDTIRLPYGRTLLAMGDVMGHGVEAAVDMSNYRSMLRVVGSADLPPHRILRQLDTMISDTQEGRPASCLLALADPSRGRTVLRPGGPPATRDRAPGRRRRDLPGPGRPAAGHRLRRLRAGHHGLAAGQRAAAVHRRTDRTPRRGHRRLPRPPARPAPVGRGPARRPGRPHPGPARTRSRRGRRGRHGRPDPPPP